MTEGISHGLCQCRFAGYLVQLSFDIGFQRLDLGLALLLTDGFACIGWLATNGVFDLIKFSDAPDDLGSDRGLSRFKDLVEFAPGVGPAKSEGYRLVRGARAVSDQVA